MVRTRRWSRREGTVLRSVRGVRFAAAVLVACLGLAACGSQHSDAGSSAASLNVGIALDTGGIGDKGINDLADSGFYQARTKLGAHGREATPQLSGTDRATVLTSLSAHHNPVIAVGSEYAKSLTAVAPKQPKTNYAIVNDGSVRADNVANLEFAVEQGSYLVGMAAALKSTSGHLGFIGATHSAEVDRYLAGFRAGALAVDAHAAVDVSYLSDKDDGSGFNAPEAARSAATTMLDHGVDAIYHDAGDSSAGLLEAVVAARESGKRNVWAIGSGQNEYLTASQSAKKVILTSMVLQADVAIYQFIKEFARGDKHSGVRMYTVKDKAVSYSKFGGYLSSKAEAKIDRAAKHIADGTISVPTTV